MGVNRVPPEALWALTECLCIVSFAARPSPYRRLYFLPIASLIFYQLAYTNISPGHQLVNENGLGVRLSILFFVSSDFLLLTDAQNELRVIGQKGGEIAKAPFWTRVWWGALLLYNPRGINWAHEPTAHIPPRPNYKDRMTFVVRRLGWIAFFGLVYDVNRSFMQANPYFNKGIPVAAGYRDVWRLAGICYMFMLYELLSAFYMILGIIFVSLHMSEPRDWPMLYGHLLEGYTVRRFWGKLWHQMWRRMFNSHAEFLTRKLNLPPKSKFTTYFKIFVAFFISGCFHLPGDYVITKSLNPPGAVQFFLLQVPAIMFEDGFLALCRRAGLRGNLFTKMIGFMWVIVWFAFSVPFWSDPQARTGFFQHQMYFGVLERVRGRVFA